MTILVVNIHCHETKHVGVLQDNVILDINVPNKLAGNTQAIEDYLESSAYNILSSKFKTEVTYCQIAIQDDNPAYGVVTDDYKNMDEDAMYAENE